ncbi:TolC family protein [Magnetovibrio sp.]|uniref:TolC family protein n=1 Tax=Magnetovibrio sp. TaxID=2024836 RepID=UPI002F924A23
MKNWAWVAVVLTGLGSVAALAQDETVITASHVLERITANGDYAIRTAAADIDIARARLAEADAGLMPTLALSATGQFYRPSAADKYPDDNAEAYGKLEVVQPIYDFGQTTSARDAAGKLAEAAEQSLVSARNTVMLEGLALFYDLHASELEVRGLNESHTSAYLKWDRAKESLALGRASPVDVAEALTLAEQSRLVYYRERTRNAGYRLRLEELMGVALPEELISPPKPPKAKHAEIDRKKFLAAVMDRNPDLVALVKQGEAAGISRDGVAVMPSLDAFANTEYTTRDLRGRNDYALGARLSWPIFDGGVTAAKKTRLAGEQSRINAKIEAKKSELRRASLNAVMNLDDAYQRVISALAQHDYTSKNLLRRQQLYAQERVADLGSAMIEHTKAEAELVRATGAYRMVQARIAVLLGEQPGRGIKPDFLAAEGFTLESGGSFVPKSGTGFGQDDAEQFKRQDIVPPPAQ